MRDSGGLGFDTSRLRGHAKFSVSVQIKYFACEVLPHD